MIQHNTRLDNKAALKGFFGFDPKHNMIFDLVFSTAFFIIRAASIPVRLLLRKNMGERAFSILGFLSSLTLFSIGGVVLFSISHEFLLNTTSKVSDLYSLYGKSGSEYWVSLLFILLLTLTNPLAIFLVLTMDLGIQHFKVVLIDIRNNVLRYSKHRGESLDSKGKPNMNFFGLKIDESITRMIIEPFWVIVYTLPLLILCLGVLFYNVDFKINSSFELLIFNFLLGALIVHFFLIFSAFCVFVEEAEIRTNLRNSALDVIDAEAESQLILEMKNQIASDRNLTAFSTGIISNNDKSEEATRSSDFSIAKIN